MARLKILFSHDGTVAMALLWLTGVAILALNFSWALLALVPVGVGAQMLNEYTIHRFVFHLPPPKSQFWFDVLYAAHYGHHDFPGAEKLFFVPVWFAVPMALVNLGLFWAGFALLGLAQPFVAAASVVLVGGISAFLAYEWFHMTAHLPVAKTRIERYVSGLHAQHHFRDFTRWYHVSPGGEIIDRAMGTAIGRDEMKRASREEFITTLGLAPDDPRLLAARRNIAARKGVDAAAIARQGRSRRMGTPEAAG